MKLKTLLGSVLLSLSPVVSFAAGQTLIFCSEGSPGGFDPSQYTSSTDFDASAATIFNTLITSERGKTNIIPSLAESWDISPDGKEYTFHLRKDVKFQTTDYFKPSRNFNADDVVFTFKRMTDPNNEFANAYKISYPYVVAMGWKDSLKDIVKVDDYTVKFILKKPNSAFFSTLIMPFTSIQSAEYAAKLLKEGRASDINIKPIGTGPFILKRYSKDTLIRYVANPDYWNKTERARVQNLIFSITPDPTIALQKVQTGECHVMASPPPESIGQIKNNPKLKLLEAPGFDIGYIGYNTEHKYLDKVEVRQALDMAINRDALIKAVYNGYAKANPNPMPPIQWSYNHSIPLSKYDPEAAKALLKKVGLEKGFDITLWALPVRRPYNPNGRLMAEMIQSDWKQIGVNAKIVTYEWGEYLRRSKSGEHDAAMFGWMGANNDPDMWLAPNISCASVAAGDNVSRWCNQEVDKLLEQGREAIGEDKRSPIYEKIQELIHQAQPASYIATSTVVAVVNNKVQGYKIDPYALHRFTNVSIEQ